MVALGTTARFLVASGSLPPGVKEDFYAQLALRASANNQDFVLDTSGAPLKAALAVGVYLFKPSLRELEELLGQSLTTESQQLQAAREIVAAARLGSWRCPLEKMVPCWSLRNKAFGHLPFQSKWSAQSAPAITLWPGFMALAKGDTLEHAFGYGMASAAAAVMNAHTNLCEPKDLQRLYQQVRITPL